MSNKIEESQEKSPESLLLKLIDLIPKFYPNRYYFNRGTETITEANIIIDALLDLELTEPQIKELLRKLTTDDEQKKLCQMTLRETEAYIIEKIYFKENLETFWNAYNDDEIDEEVCISLISDDPHIQKQQLQITLGILGPYTKGGRIIAEHQNKRLKLQEALIQKLSEEEQRNPSILPFLSSVLREFVFRPCDGGQIPSPNASTTIKLLMDAGADPNFDHLDINYQSPGEDFVNFHFAGITLLEEVSQHKNLNAETIIENKKMQRELEKKPVKIANSPEILLCNLVHLINGIKEGGGRDRKGTAVRMVNELIEHGYHEKNLNKLFDFVKLNYFKKYDKREDDDEIKKSLPSAFMMAEDFIRDIMREKKLLEDFQNAFESVDDEDDDCVHYLSDNPETLKKQLQIALGVYTKLHTPWHFTNKRINLQREIIERIQDQVFLSCALRDFVFQCCCFGQIPCPNAPETVQLLINAGADPNIDHFESYYDSPGAKATAWNDGCSLYEEVSLFSFGPIFAGRAIWDVLTQRPKKKIINSPEILLCNLINTVSGFLSQPEDPSRKNIERAKKISIELLTTVESFEDLYHLFQRVKNQYYQDIDKLNDDDPKKIKFLSSFRGAEALILESLYQCERHDEHRLLHMMKISLFFAPLILPLIFTAIVAILYAIKTHHSNYLVKKTDLTLEEFTGRFTHKDRVDIHPADSDEEIVDKIEHSYAMKLPVKSKDENKQLRKAVVFNRKIISPGSLDIPYFRLVNIFNGTSAISPKEEGKLKTDVRIYEVNIDETSHNP